MRRVGGIKKKISYERKSGEVPTRTPYSFAWTVRARRKKLVEIVRLFAARAHSFQDPSLFNDSRRIIPHQGRANPPRKMHPSGSKGNSNH